MSRKKPKALNKKHTSQPDIKPEEAAKTLREEILEEVKLLALGKISSVYGLVGKGKELIEIEAIIEGPKTQKAPAKTQEPELTVNDI